MSKKQNKATKQNLTVQVSNRYWEGLVHGAVIGFIIGGLICISLILGVVLR